MRNLKSHPLLKLANSYLIDSPQPSNISYLWNFGSLLGLCLVIQIITGVTLAMHYNPSVLEAFNSVEHKLVYMCALFIILPLYYLVSVKHLNIKKRLISNFVVLEPVFENTVYSLNINTINHFTDEQFREWFRGLVDGEGSFSIVPSKNNFYFKFAIYMHKDDTPMLEAIAFRLKVGYVNIGNHFVCYSVTSQQDLVKIFNIFDIFPLNTSKHLNYLA
jgi:hypothetical protein